jgi:hypothetical protein
MAIRILDLGLWLVLATGVLCRVVFIRRAWIARFARSSQAIPDKEAADQHWLRGVVWSCLWIGLAGLIIHAWCTLGLGYCLSRVVAIV